MEDRVTVAKDIVDIDTAAAKEVQDEKNIDIWDRLDSIEDQLEEVDKKLFFQHIISIIGFLIIVVLLSIIIL